MSRTAIIRVVPITQSSGVVRNVHLVLNNKPNRQSVKVKTLGKYVQLHPKGWKKRLEQAELLYAAGSWEKAVEEYYQVLKRQPRLLEARLQLGKILQLMAREIEAIEVYECAKALTSNVATQYHIKGLIELCHCRQNTAIKMFELAASLEPNNAAHWFILGQNNLEIDAHKAALRAFDVILEHNSDDIVALIHSYDALMAAGNFQEAQQRLSRIQESAPNYFRALKRLADHRTRMRLVWGEEGKQTKQLIQTALRQAPDSAEAHQSQAYYHLFQGKNKKGIAVLQTFVEQHPKNPNGWYHLARCLFHTGEFNAATTAILKAYALYQNDCEIYIALCDILPAAGKLEMLQPFMAEMLACFAQRWRVWVTAGLVWVENFKDYEQGCLISSKATRLQPQLAEPWFRHGRVLALAGRHQQAVDALAQGWQWLPEDGGYVQSVPAAMWLGESYQALGEYATSQDWFQSAIERAKKLMDFNPAMAYYWQGKALEALEDVTAAKWAYQQALNLHLLYPTCWAVNKTLKKLLL